MGSTDIMRRTSVLKQANGIETRLGTWILTRAWISISSELSCTMSGRDLDLCQMTDMPSPQPLGIKGFVLVVCVCVIVCVCMYAYAYIYIYFFLGAFLRQ